MINQKPALRVLLIEDDEDDFILTEDLLKSGHRGACSVDWVSYYEAGLSAILKLEHDIAIIDYRLNAESGIDLIQQARKHNVRMPIILLTGQGDDELDISAIELGASDYLVKGQIDSTSLARSIRYAIDRCQREQAFLQLMTDARDAMLVIDDSRCVQYANPAAELLLDTPEHQLLLRHISLPETTENLFEWSLPLSDEHHIDVEVQRSRTEWSGQVMQLLSLRDITARKESEKQLRLLLRSLEATHNGVIIADARLPDLPITYVNAAFEQMTGFTPEEVIGKNCRFLQQSQTDQPGMKELRQSLADKQEVSIVLRNFRKDGSPFWNDLFIAPVPDEHGETTHFIGIQTDITRQRSAESALAYNASHDVLTGLPNRTLLEDRLGQACIRAHQNRLNLAVIFFNLDGFKPINDTLGHNIGDLVLVEVANRINPKTRPGDTLARLSADEFVVVLPDLSRDEDVLEVVEAILESLARPYLLGDHKLRITASAGIALSDGSLDHPMTLVQRADLAMHQAKQSGRNTYHWFTDDLNQSLVDRVTLRNELQKAIETDAFELHYQPLVDARSGIAIGMEALLRWNHPERGYIAPVDFIPIAEDTGQIIPLSQRVLETACRENRMLYDSGLTHNVVSVNVSPIQFQPGNFVEIVKKTLEQTRLPPHLLELEIVESVLLHDPAQVIQTLHKLRELGVGISIDDFGTGFSSLSYLKLLPITKIKIDRSFINEIIKDTNDAAITQGIISMAHHLKLKVVAEGVETEPQAAFLRKNSCDILQGYFFAKPMPMVQLKDYLNKNREPNVTGKKEGACEEPPQTLLLLDDEKNILRALSRVLRQDGYQILTATKAQDAFELLAKHEVQVILSDQRMPEMNGTEFLSTVKELYPDTIRIILSGYTDLKSVTEAINEGAIYKFLTKPWDDGQLRSNVHEAFQHFHQLESDF